MPFCSFLFSSAHIFQNLNKKAIFLDLLKGWKDSAPVNIQITSQRHELNSKLLSFFQLLEKFGSYNWFDQWIWNFENILLVSWNAAAISKNANFLFEKSLSNCINQYLGRLSCFTNQAFLKHESYKSFKAFIIFVIIVIVIVIVIIFFYNSSFPACLNALLSC